MAEGLGLTSIKSRDWSIFKTSGTWLKKETRGMVSPEGWGSALRHRHHLVLSAPSPPLWLCCAAAIKGEGLFEGLDWLSNTLKTKRR